MAGVGFELRRLSRRPPSLWNGLRIFTAAGLVAAGPWILTTLTMLAVGLLGDDASEFRALVTAGFVWSLILVGGLQTATTRHVADLLYAGQHDRVVASFSAACQLGAPVLVVVGLVLARISGLPSGATFAYVVLVVAVGLQWVALSWLTVIRDPFAAMTAFLGGMALSIASVTVAGAHGRLATQLLAFAAGQGATLVLLARQILAGTSASPNRSYAVLGALKRYPVLLLIGATYSVGIWADKLVLWFGDGLGEGLLLRHHPLYDTCAFVAYLTTLPALAANLVHLETGFYEAYRGYYDAVLEGGTLDEIHRHRARMVESLRAGAGRLLRTQGFVTLCCLVFAPEMAWALGLPPAAAAVLRPLCAGAMLHVLLLVAMLVLLYFDRRREALCSAGLFLGLNLLGGLLAAGLGTAGYGFGYALAALVALVFAVTRLERAFERLEYLTFRDV